MNAADVRKVLIVQAVEQADEHDHLVTSADRAEAAAISGAPLPKGSAPDHQESFLTTRSEVLLTRISNRALEEADWLRATTPKHWIGLTSGVLLVIAVITGFLTNELGPEKRINILSFPLLGIILWSIFIYLRELFLFCQSPDRLFRGGWIKACIRLNTAPSNQSVERESDSNSLKSARLIFEQRWFDLTLPVFGAKMKSSLHLIALAFAAAAILGMYVQGLANEYRAVWESTFFTEASQVRPFLQTVLGPAAALSGSEFPSEETLATMHWQAGQPEVAGENAARWIHWYAITIGLFVILPRGILSLIWKLKSEQFSRTLPYREVAPHYFDHLLAISSGTAKPVCILPYAFDPDGALRRGIVGSLEFRFQCPIEVHWSAPVPFGEEESPADLENAEDEAILIPLFSFASTPEKETHLDLFRTLSSAAPNPVEFILLDTTAFDEKSMNFPDAEQRRAGRLEAWNLLFTDEKVHFLLTGAVPEASLPVPPF